MSARQRVQRRSAELRRLERWLWTGPVGHLVGGGLDVIQALAGHVLRRWVGRRRRGGRAR